MAAKNQTDGTLVRRALYAMDIKEQLSDLLRPQQDACALDAVSASPLHR